MSRNERHAGGQPSAAGDVTFARLADRDRHGESSSQAESASSGYRSSRERRRSREAAVTATDMHSNHTSPDDRDKGTPHSNRRSGGFLLDSEISLGGSPREDGFLDRHGKRRVQNGHLHVGKTRHADKRLSADSSLRSSPLSRELSTQDGVPDGRQTQRASRPASLDPAQLVQMALELSESRKRHGSGSIHLPISSPGNRRGASGLSSNYGTVRSHSPSVGTRAKDLNEQLPRSRTSFIDGPADERGLQGSGDARDDLSSEFAQPPSPATLSRAEKARRYFELASEHRRLLERLPPLKPDSSAPGNYTFVSTSSPGSAHAQITRVTSPTESKHHLGRAYNPLQALRNRRLRIRERRQLTALPETWQDVQSVKGWVDDVESATQKFDYRSAPDRVRLPSYTGNAEIRLDASTGSRGHRRTDTAGSVITRGENGWSIEPSELLADTYWMETDDNKTLVENRLGNAIFTPQQRSSVERPRKSVELKRKLRKSEELARNAKDESRIDSDTSDAPVTKRAHRRTHLLPSRHRRLPRSGSPSSISSAEGRAPPEIADEGVENTGPLERHMQQMIVRDERGELSPDLVSPDHWESQHTQFPVLRDAPMRKRGNTLKRDEARLSVDTQLTHRRAKSADGRVVGGRNLIASPVKPGSEGPQSPIVAGVTPATGMGFSPTVGQLPSERKSKFHILPAFRSHSKERNNIERTDFAIPNDNRLSIDQPRSSQESARPSFVQRQKTADSFSSSLRRQGTATTFDASKDSGSGVGRFLKGGRIGELVRNEGSRLSDRLRNRDRTEDGESPGPSRNSLEGPEYRDEVDARPPQAADGERDPSPRTSPDQSNLKPKYYLPNLPSFKLPVGRNKQTPVQSPLSTGSDPIGRQQREQREAGRSTRFDRLAPPRINLPDGDHDSTTGDLTFNSYTALDDRRKSYGFLEHGSKAVSRATSAPEHGNGLTPGQHHGRRHWSISDRLPPQQSSKVTRRDVARVKALLLSSGVKAREIQLQADTVRDAPLHFIHDTVDHDISSPPRKEELVVAARILSDTLDSTLSQFEHVVRVFDTETARTLASHLEDLRRKAVDQLTKQLHETSDDADAFTVELTTKGPQDVKRVDDGIDNLLRRRNRQFRLLRRAGFKLLEWLVLGIMWWVWFVVVVFNSVKKVVVGFLRFLRWLFFF